ncbi:TetR/AcrR family transcriptional regulator C-terminal domain-containing protein [Streptomyces albus]|uniref:TetR/AcrR family transcriptional regulator C-terminal domain-containing protein n=1 Tax=Streptomyces TaxID=1883 RepID=UPI001CEC2EF3|nr:MULTISPECIES: TetR/AcrR family transcriptional regulator C-terminal domain-containing protein [Streptomyces]MDI6413351.1 TetR/AcrR family transcriptional regulator C-terminal domain-containing protein [Streptomyces albus]
MKPWRKHGLNAVKLSRVSPTDPAKRPAQRPAERPAKKKPASPRLDRTLVAETGLRLLNETGLEGLSLRRIAKELNVQAPALYWHFDSKQALLDEMATVMTRDLLTLADEIADETVHRSGNGPVAWDTLIGESMRHLRRALLRYRDGAKVYSGTRLTTTEHGAAQERALRVMTDAGFSPGAAARAWATAYSYTIGFVIEEQAVQPLPGERAPGYDPADRAARMAEHPLAAQVSADLFADYDTRFEEGLHTVIEGIRVTVLRT